MDVSARQVFQDQTGQTVALLAGQTLYLSAVAPSDASAEIGQQTHSAMDRLGEVLGMAKLGYSHVVSCHVHLSDMENYAAMNSVYGSYFSEGGYPARTTVELPGLPGGVGVLLGCIAYADAQGIEVVRPPEDEIPAPMGPYSPAVRAGGTVYLSGQGGRDPSTGKLAASAAEQAEQTLQTIDIILRAAGLTYDNAVLAISYLPPSSEEAEIDGAFEAVFSPGGAPSRSMVALSELPGGIAVEITFIAVEDSYATRLFMHNHPPTASSSPASLSGGVLYASSTAGSGETFRRQYEHAMRSQAEALGLASLDLRHVVRVTAYLRDLDRMEELRALVAETFPENPPAATVLQTRNPSGSDILLELIAVQ